MTTILTGEVPAIADKFDFLVGRFGPYFDRNKLEIN